MKSRNQGRKRKSGVAIHPLLRIDETNRELHDRYSPEERSEIYNRALTTIFPAVQIEKSVPVLIRPPETVTNTVCRVVIAGRWVRLFLPEKRDDFRNAVRRYFYRWEGCWEREFSDSIDIIDRAAEIANEVLIIGICIQIENDKIKDRLIDKTFAPEAFKTIRRGLEGAYKDYFVIRWPKTEDCYDKAMRITAAKYSDGLIYVPPEHFAEVEDFAEINDFVLSEAAIALVAEAKIARESAIIIQPQRKTRRNSKKKNESSRKEVPAHLRDDFDD
jgi:hypothetical protein